MLLILLLFICVALLVAEQFYRLYKMDKSVANLPTLHLHSSYLGRFSFRAFAQFAKTFYKTPFAMSHTFKYWIGPFLNVVVIDKQDLKVVFKCIDKPLCYKIFPDMMLASTYVRNGIITQTN